MIKIMKVREFINSFIEPNSLVRLWYKTSEGNYTGVIRSNEPLMEHELIESAYKDEKVIGVKSIHCLGSHYPEAINLVIERSSLNDGSRENKSVTLEYLDSKPLLPRECIKVDETNKIND